MGLVHTGIRSRLGVDKVRKTTMVGMDIKRMHVETGLLHARGKRNFTGSTSSPEDEESDIGNSDDQDPLDFRLATVRCGSCSGVLGPNLNLHIEVRFE